MSFWSGLQTHEGMPVCFILGICKWWNRDKAEQVVVRLVALGMARAVQKKQENGFAAAPARQHCSIWKPLKLTTAAFTLPLSPSFLNSSSWGMIVRLWLEGTDVFGAVLMGLELTLKHLQVCRMKLQASKGIRLMVRSLISSSTCNCNLNFALNPGIPTSTGFKNRDELGFGLNHKLHQAAFWFSNEILTHGFLIA